MRLADRVGRRWRRREGLLADSRVDAIYLALLMACTPNGLFPARRQGSALREAGGSFRGRSSEISATAQETGNLFMEAMKCRFGAAHKRICAALDADGLAPSRA